MLRNVDAERPARRLASTRASTSEGRSRSRGRLPSFGTRCLRAMVVYRSIVACLRSLAGSAFIVQSSSQAAIVIDASLTGAPASTRSRISRSFARTSAWVLPLTSPLRLAEVVSIGQGRVPPSVGPLGDRTLAVPSLRHRTSPIAGAGGRPAALGSLPDGSADSVQHRSDRGAGSAQVRPHLGDRDRRARSDSPTSAGCVDGAAQAPP